MSKRDFLLEIGLEEMPARFVDGALAQLSEKIKRWFEEQRISYDRIFPYATPRRLTLWIRGVAETQADQVEEAKGPAKRIALDEEGNWTKAAEGFARGQGISPDQLYFKEFKGEDYVYVTKELKGKTTASLLPQLKEVIVGLTFPKNMRWGSYDLKFARPIRWLVALYGTEVIPFEITDVHTDRKTYGHRFLGHEIELNQPEDYAPSLLEQYVIVSVEEREKAIRSQLQQLEDENGWQIPIDERLLNEIIHLVEYPTALYGSFDENYLTLPQEVLITTMKEHQRYFPVLDAQHNLLPFFVTVRNGEVDPEGIVAKGNEKVLRARLADARFFYDEDKKMTISSALSQLENVVFHEDLGSVGDKVRRIREICATLAEKLQISDQTVQDLDRAAEICKFDLVSQMVYEFPELQGRMGQEYAMIAGESEEVSRAVYEHYMPRSAKDHLPETAVGSILSIADKIDTIVGCFSLGMIPTGSQDPYALRRQASGIVQIMLKEQWPMTIVDLFKTALDVYKNRQLMKRDEYEVLDELRAFFELRLKNRLQESGVRYDVIDAVCDQLEIEPYAVLAKAEVLMEQVEQDEFKSLVESLTRVSNLASKIDQSVQIQPVLFESNEEHDLYEAFLQVQKEYETNIENKHWKKAYQSLIPLKTPIDHFFDHVMVMVDHDEVRLNRLSLLHDMSNMLRSYADFSNIVFANKS